MSGPDHAKHSLAINLLRAINTAENDYQQKHGAYAPWDTLLNSEEFTQYGIKLAARNEPKLGTVHLSNGPEILTGWRLRLDLTAESKGYNVILEDTEDKQCGYAAITDERGLIRQGKVINCPI